jgi:hypothetical protein
MQTHEPNGPENVDTSLGYEQRDARVSGVVTFLLVLSFVAAVIGGIAYGFGKWMNARMIREDGPKDRWSKQVDVRSLGNMASGAEMEKTVGTSIQRYPTPRVQMDDGNQDVADLHTREDLLLENYSWADQALGKVRIPIERAMELMAQRGLSVAIAVKRAPLMTGEGKPVVVAPLTDGFARTRYEQDQATVIGSRAR